MNKIFTKVATLSVGLMMAIGVGVALGAKNVSKASAEEVTITPSQFTAVENTNVDETISDIRFQISNGTITAEQVRVFKSATLTITAPEGYDLTSVELTCTASGTSKYGPGCFAELEGYSYDGNVGTWSGSAESIALTASSNQVRVTQFVINYSSDAPTTFTVTYNSNGGSGTLVDPKSPYESGAKVTVLANTFTKTDCVFHNWNTAANGSGTSYDPDDSFEIGANTTLYAQWDDYSSGSLNNPYSVAQARAAIDGSGDSKTGVHAIGIVSQIVTAFNPTYGNITFNISTDGTTSSNQLQAYRCTSSTAHPITSDADIEVGATVIVKGNLKKFNSTYEFDQGCTVESYKAPTAKKYSVTGTISNGALTVSEILEGSTLEVRIDPAVGYFYPSALTSVTMGGESVDYTYSAGLVTVANVTGDIVITAACVSCNPIYSLYGKVNGSEANDFYGYYVGFSIGNGPIIMDGQYGMMLYNKDLSTEGWVEGETIIHVLTGKVKIFNGLVEIDSGFTFETVETADIAKPITHITTGSETIFEANRFTNATGKVIEVTKGSLDAEAVGTSDIEFTFQVGSNSFKVYYKKAAQTPEITAELSKSLDNSEDITIKGFTSWYNVFQLTVTGIVEPSEDYTAEMFAQDLLDQTDLICANYEPKEPGEAQDPSYDTIRALLVAAWSDLAGEHKYPSLSNDQKTILAKAERVESGTVVEQAMARYDFLTGKYNLDNFINGRTPVKLNNYNEFNAADNNSMIYIIVAISAVSVASLGVLIALKKKRAR